MAKWYFSMFWGRDDVYAKRGSKGGYFPQCNNLKCSPTITSQLASFPV